MISSTGGVDGGSRAEHSLLYLLETSSVAVLADRLKMITKSLEEIAAEPPVPWKVELANKTIFVNTQAGQRTTGKPESTGEGLYVVKTSEYPGSCFMLATRQKAAQGATKGRRPDVQYGDLVETGSLGEEIMTLVKGYENRLTMSIEGSTYNVAETVKASIGFYSKQKRLTSLALQVRYELTGATPEEAHRVLRQFVSGLLTGVAEDVKPKMIQADLSLGGAHCRNVMNYIELFRQ